MLISLYAPSSKNSGLILNLNYGIGIAIPYAIDLMIKRQSFYKDIDYFSVFSLKIQLQLSIIKNGFSAIGSYSDSRN